MSNSSANKRGELKKILLVAITRMGDLLQASPTIVGLKAENPGAHLTVLVDRQFAAICRGIPGIDEIYEIDMSIMFRAIKREKDGIVDAYRYLDTFVRDLKSRNFDYCLNISSSGYTALLLKMLEIKDSRGWISDEQGFRLISNPWAMLFAAFVYHSNRDYNSINIVDIFRCSAGVREHPRRLVFEVAEEAKDFPDSLLGEVSTAEGPLVCVQVGASQEKRQWSPARFAYLVRMLVEQLNARVVLTGAKSEIPITERVLSIYSTPRVVNAAGRTNLDQLGALLERADVLITGDTGPMHLAVAVGTPVVALFLASALCFETGPYSTGNFVMQPQIGCNPCNPNFSCARPDCHDQISPELVFALTKARLEVPIGEEHRINLPTELADPKQVAVYLTGFDEHGFLEFRPMVSGSVRNGYPSGYYDAARIAYRRLWKEEFERLKADGSTAQPPLPVLNGAADQLLTGIAEAKELAQRGVDLTNELMRLIDDLHSPPRLLGEVGNAIEKNIREIEEVGLSYPVLGALVRVFIMEKENMRGDDARILASEMKELYRRLESRGEKFKTFLSSSFTGRTGVSGHRRD